MYTLIIYVPNYTHYGRCGDTDTYDSKHEVVSSTDTEVLAEKLSHYLDDSDLECTWLINGDCMYNDPNQGYLDSTHQLDDIVRDRAYIIKQAREQEAARLKAESKAAEDQRLRLLAEQRKIDADCAKEHADRAEFERLRQKYG